MNPFAHFPPQPLPSGSAWAEKPGVITEIRQTGPLWAPQGPACKPSDPLFPSSRLQPLTHAEGPDHLTSFGFPPPTPGLSLQRVGRLSPSLRQGLPLPCLRSQKSPQCSPCTPKVWLCWKLRMGLPDLGVRSDSVCLWLRYLTPRTLFLSVKWVYSSNIYFTGL